MTFYYQEIKNKSTKYKVLFYLILSFLILNLVAALVIWIRVEYYNKGYDGYWWNIILSGLAIFLSAVLYKRESSNF